MVVLSQETSDSKPGLPQMLDVEIEVIGARLRVCVNYLHMDITQSDPFSRLVASTFGRVLVSSSLFGICPRSCDIQVCEVDFVALSTQFAGQGIHSKQCVFGALAARDLYQSVLPRLHQIESLTMNILQVGIANGRAGRRAGRFGRQGAVDHQLRWISGADRPVELCVAGPKGLKDPTVIRRRAGLPTVHG